MCVAVGKDDKITKYLSWFMLMVNSVIPFVSILSMNLVILVAMHRRPKNDSHFGSVSNSTLSDSKISVGESKVSEFEKISDNDVSVTVPEENSANVNKANSPISTVSQSIIRKKSSRDSRSDTQLVIMLLFVSFAFLVLTLPLNIRSIVYAFGFSLDSTNQELAQTSLVVAITSRLMMTNSAINFWLYCLSGKRFRQDLKSFVSRCFSKG